jgi:PadR family transcriptional regulator, regulatory protein AphA
MNVKTLCLGVLSFGEASGYEIKKMVEDGRFSHFIDASFGSIYPALTQLTAEGLLTVRAEEQTGKPDKKVYAITPPGRAALAKAISTVPQRDTFKSEFLFQMLLADYLPPPVIALAYDAQLANLRGDLACVNECGAQALNHDGAALVNGYGRAVLTSAIEYLESRRAAFLAGRALQAAE